MLLIERILYAIIILPAIAVLVFLAALIAVPFGVAIACFVIVFTAATLIAILADAILNRIERCWDWLYERLTDWRYRHNSVRK